MMFLWSFFSIIVAFEMPSDILSASNVQFAEVLWTKSLSTITCLNAALNCWRSGLSLNPSFPLMMEKRFSK